MASAVRTEAACLTASFAPPRSTMIERAARDFRTAWQRREQTGLIVNVAFPPLDGWEANVARKAAYDFSLFHRTPNWRDLYRAEVAAINAAEVGL